MKANKICPICGKEFMSYDLRKRYCSTTCFKRSRSMQTIKSRANRNADKRMDWAHSEAEHLNHLAYECGVDELADYIYNNYNKRSK